MIPFTDKMKKFELKYWGDHRRLASSEHQNYYDRLEELFPFDGHRVVADVGCGPLGGIFFRHFYERMFGVDPLWEQYRERGLDKAPDNVQRITATASDFSLPEEPDLIVSTNALDHSGDIVESIRHIYRQLAPGGSFFLHVHLRTPEQFNQGHRMEVKEEELRRTLRDLDADHLSCRVSDRDPLRPRKPYRTFIGEIKK